MKVYISGPITGIENYEDAFRIRAEWLEGEGHEAVNPCDIKIEECHCDLKNDPAGLHKWSCYMKHDLRLMLDCDAITVLSGWQASHGARTEVMVAAAVGLKFVEL